MKTTYFITLLFIFFSFCSFASESDSKPLNQKEITTNHLSEKSKITTKKTKKKLNFKERLALKLVKKKIKKVQKKEAKNIKSIKGDGGATFLAFLVILIASTGVIAGIIYLTLGQILTGVLLLLGGFLLIPLFILTYVIISLITWNF